jgi:hypothetical protein
MKAWVVGEFPEEHALLAAARSLREAGQRSLDIHSPYPLHGADEALGLRRSTVPLVALGAGITGAVSGYLLQYYVAAVAFPINVGSRPPHAPPAFVPVTFELGVLFAAGAIFLGLLFAYFRFPRVHHPVFEVDAFRSASIDGLWLSAEVAAGEAEPLAERLRGLGARHVTVVPEAKR